MEKIQILYEDDEIFLLNKRAGVSVQGGKGVSHPLDEEFSAQVGKKVHLVHRLDKETCGILVVAKDARAAAKWVSLISGKQVRKEYEAVCIGVPKVGGVERMEGKIDSSVLKGGRALPAQTRFTVLEKWARKIEWKDAEGNGNSAEIGLSRLSLLLGTGRTHQIRIHLAEAGSPIAGDDAHGDFKKNKILRKIGVRRLLLCAKKITLPIGGRQRTFEIELPEYFSLG